MKKRLLYSYIEQINGIKFLKEIGYDTVDFEKEIIEAENILTCLSSNFLEKLKSNIPSNTPFFIENIDFSKDEITINKAINSNFEGTFDYINWRKKENLGNVNLKSRFQVLPITLNKKWNKIVQKKIILLFNNEVGNHLKKSFKNIIKVKFDYFKCVFMPLNKNSFIVQGEDIKYNLDLFYMIHETCHVIINFYQLKYDVCLSIEEEEYWVHLYEAAIIKSIFKEKYIKKYVVFLKNILQENKALTQFQIELFMNIKTLKTIEDKKKLYVKIYKEYGIDIEKSEVNLNDFNFLQTPFYSANYLIGQERVLSTFKSIKFKNIHRDFLLFISRR